MKFYIIKELFKLKPFDTLIISHIYSTLLSEKTLWSLDLPGKRSWERDLRMMGGERQLLGSTPQPHVLGLIQFKVIHSLHFSKTRLSEIYPDLEDRCGRCGHN